MSIRSFKVLLVLVVMMVGLSSCMEYKYTPRQGYNNRENSYDRYKAKQLQREQLRYYRNENSKRYKK